MSALRPLAVLFAMALPLFAQEASAGSAESAPAAVPRQARRAAAVVSLSFPGGTMGDFVAAIRRTVAKVNIVLSEPAARVTLPPLELLEAGLAQTLEVACQVAEGPYEVRMKEFRGEGEWIYTITAPKAPQVRPESVTPASPPRTMMRVLSLAGLVNGRSAMRVESVLSAIELACEPLAGTTPVRLRFHEDSGLLIAVGSDEQIAQVQEVLQTLRQARAEREAAEAQGAAAERAARASTPATTETR